MTPDEIQAIPLFEHVPRKRHAEVGRMADRITLPAGKIIVRQGDLAHEFFVIIDGVADVIVNGRRAALLGPGDFFGEIGLIGHPVRTATVVAGSDLDLAVIGRREFRALLRRFPDLARTVLRAGSRRVVTTLRAVESPAPDRDPVGVEVGGSLLAA
jgi:CRP/FNR family cyclic AMP-dependent transcriptional regulator